VLLETNEDSEGNNADGGDGEAGRDAPVEVSIVKTSTTSRMTRDVQDEACVKEVVEADVAAIPHEAEIPRQPVV
jgi:hypothetical protein